MIILNHESYVLEELDPKSETCPILIEVLEVLTKSPPIHGTAMTLSSDNFLHRKP